jgi:hypothetical protein
MQSRSPAWNESHHSHRHADRTQSVLVEPLVCLRLSGKMRFACGSKLVGGTLGTLRVQARDAEKLKSASSARSLSDYSVVHPYQFITVSEYADVPRTTLNALVPKSITFLYSTYANNMGLRGA